MEELRRCKKCGKPLPQDDKHKLCENCRTKHVYGMKKAVGVAVAIGSAGAAAVKYFLNQKKC